MKIIITLLLLLISSLYLISNANGKKHKDLTMKDNELSIIIKKPIEDVFEFTTNPHNTPLWLDCVSIEQTNEWPPREGTIYQNRGKDGPWAKYKVSKFTEDKEFELIKEDDSTYHVNYHYSTCSDGSTKLVYHEWVTKGEIEGPFSQQDLEKLKLVMENQPRLSSIK